MFPKTILLRHPDLLIEVKKDLLNNLICLAQCLKKNHPQSGLIVNKNRDICYVQGFHSEGKENAFILHDVLIEDRLANENLVAFKWKTPSPYPHSDFFPVVKMFEQLNIPCYYSSLYSPGVNHQHHYFCLLTQIAIPLKETLKCPTKDIKHLIS